MRETFQKMFSLIFCAHYLVRIQKNTKYLFLVILMPISASLVDVHRTLKMELRPYWYDDSAQGRMGNSTSNSSDGSVRQFHCNA